MPVMRSSSRPARHTLASAALLVTVLIWGTTLVATKLALADVPPFTLTLLRFVLASAVLIPLAWIEQERRGHPPLPWRALVLAGLLGGCMFFALQNLGLVYTTASKASLILAGVPALTALLSVLMLSERLTRARAAGVLASVAGVVVLVLADRGASLQSQSLIGDLLLVVTALSWAFYTIISKGMEQSASPTVVSAATVGFGALFMLPFVAYELFRQPPRVPSPTSALAIAYLGLLASTLPFMFWNYALTQVDASEAAVYINVVPLVTVITAVLVLHERVALGQLAGGMLVLFGVWAAGHQTSRHTPSAREALPERDAAPEHDPA